MLKIFLTLVLSFLSGCTQYGSGYRVGFFNSSSPYAQQDFDQLHAFEADMANSSNSARAEICESLLRSQNSSPGTELQLHLLAGRLLSDACGDIQWLIDRAASIPLANLSDVRLQRFVTIHVEALKRLRTQQRKLASQNSRQKPSQDLQKSKEPVDSKKEDPRALREKLDAIRSIEKHIDESSDEN